MVNAIIHRDYSMTGSDIKVAVFDSKIEITSPGCFPKGITIEEVFGGRSEIRNKVIVRIFKEANKIEQWGRGVQRIIELCKAKGLKKPEIIESGMFVKYIFYRQSDVNHNDKSYGKSHGKSDGKSYGKSDDNSNVSTYIEKIIDYLRSHKEINIGETMKLLNLSKSRSNDILRSMQNKGIIIKRGSSRATKYILNDK